MDFDPDEYFSDFNPDEYFSDFNPDEYFKEKTTLVEDIKSGTQGWMSKGAQGLIAADTGLASLLGASPEALQKNIELQQSVKQYWEKKDPALNKKQGLGGKIVSGLAQLPAWIGPQAAFQVAGQATQQGQSVIDQGGDLQTALSAYGISAGTNAALAALPPAIRGSITTRLLSGAGIGAASTGVEPWLINEIRTAQGLPEIPMPELEDYLAGASLGAGIGGLAGQKAKPKTDLKANKVLKNLDEIASKQEPIKQEPIQDTPKYKTQGELLLDAPNEVDVSGAKNPYDIGGKVSELQKGLDTEQGITQGDLLSGEVPPHPTSPEWTPRPLAESIAEVYDPRNISEAPPKLKGGLSGVIKPFSYSDTNQVGAKPLNKYLAGYDENTGTIDSLKTLDIIANSLDRPQYSRIVGVIKKLVSEFGSGILPRIRLEQKLENGTYVQLEYAETDVSRSAGYYNKANHEIVLGSKGMNDGTILHEILHAMTVRFIEFRPNDVAVMQLKRLFEDLKASGKLNDYYGMTNVKEMVSEAFASPKFQQLLADFKSNPSKETISSLVQNGMIRFIDAVRSLFGLRPDDFTALENVIGLSNRIIKKQAQEFKQLQLEARKEYEGYLKTQIDSSPDPIGVQKIGKEIPDGKDFTHALSVPEKRTNAFSRTPLGKSLDGTFIPDDVSVESVVAEGLASKQTSPLSGLIGGGTMLNEIKQNPVVYGIVNWYNNAKKRADFNIKTYVKPSEKSMDIALKESPQMLHGIFMKELNIDSRYSPAQLKEAGVPEKQIIAYSEFRDMMDKAWEAQNKARVDIGLKELTKREAYISSRWQGNWRTPVYNKEGAIVWYIAETTKGKAQQALDYLASKDSSLDLNRSKVEYSGISGRQKTTIEAGYEDMLRLLDKDDPRVSTLKTIYEDYMQQIGEGALGQSKHFEVKKGVRGFTGDRPWVDPVSDIKDMFRQQFQYAKNAFEWAELQKATGKAKEIFSNTELQEKQPNAITVGKEYAKNSLGFGSHKAVQGVENAVAELLHVSPSTLGKAVGVPRTAFYWLNLGFFNLGYTAVSLIQPIYTMPWHRKLSAEGFKHNPVKTIAGGMQDAVGMMIQELGGHAPLTVLGEQARAYAIDNGIIDINAMSDVADVGRSTPVQNIEKYITANMTYSEKMARSVAFMSYVHHLDQSGKYTDQSSMFQRAEELTTLSMADYRIHERAPIFNRLGITGSALSTLNTFKINQYNQLYKLAKDASKGQVTPLLTLLGLQMTMAGAMGMFAVDTLDSLWEFLKENLPAKAYNDVKDLTIKGALAKAAFKNPDTSWLVYGGASAVTGVNFSSRFNSGTIIDPTFEGLFPFAGDTLDRGAKIKKFFMDPTDPVAVAEAIQGVLPTAFRGAHQVQSDILQQGDIAKKIKDPTEGAYRRDEFDKTVKTLGLTSLKESAEREVGFRGDVKIKQMTEKRKEVMAQIKRAALFGQPEKLKDFLELYSALDGNLEELSSTIGDAAIKNAVSKMEMLQIKAKTPQGAKELNQYVR